MENSHLNRPQCSATLRSPWNHKVATCNRRLWSESKNLIQKLWAIVYEKCPGKGWRHSCSVPILFDNISLIYKGKKCHNCWIKNRDSCHSDRIEWVKNAFFLRHFSAVRIFMGSKYSFWMFYHGPNGVHFYSFRTLEIKVKFKKIKVWNSICTYAVL